MMLGWANHVCSNKGNCVIKNLPQLFLIIPSVPHKEQSSGLRIQFLLTVWGSLSSHHTPAAAAHTGIAPPWALCAAGRAEDLPHPMAVKTDKNGIAVPGLG